MAIDEQKLAKFYGTNRTPMREALKVLHAEGLVTLEPRRGCFVTELTEQDLEDDSLIFQDDFNRHWSNTE